MWLTRVTVKVIIGNLKLLFSKILNINAVHKDNRSSLEKNCQVRLQAEATNTRCIGAYFSMCWLVLGGCIVVAFAG